MNPRPAKPSRSVEREIVIRVPTEAVWKALTDPTELTRWFPLEAEVSPGAGGEIRMRWPEGESMGGPIEAWDPGVHLRLGPVAGAPVKIATDYHLRSEGGTTVLRVVSSGFAADEEWDELYEAWGRGWDFELRGLRHYLEHHRGTARLVAWVRTSYRISDQDAWRRLVGPRGWLGTPGLANLAEGDRYAVRTITGHSLSGEVRTWHPGRQFSGTVEEWNNALFRIELFGSVATVWLSTYGVARDRVTEAQSAWKDSLASALVNLPSPQRPS